MACDQELPDRLRELVQAETGLTEKRMFGGLAFLINGNMAVSASGQGGLLLRVDPAETDDEIGDVYVEDGPPVDVGRQPAADGRAGRDAEVDAGRLHPEYPPALGEREGVGQDRRRVGEDHRRRRPPGSPARRPGTRARAPARRAPSPR